MKRTAFPDRPSSLGAAKACSQPARWHSFAAPTPRSAGASQGNTGRKSLAAGATLPRHEPTQRRCVQPLDRNEFIDREDGSRECHGQPPRGPEKGEPGDAGNRDHVQDAEEDVGLRRHEPCHDGDRERSKHDDDEAPAPRFPPDPVAVREIKARAREKQKAAGDNGRKRPPMELLRVAAFFQAEKLEVENEMEDGHAEQGRAPEEVHECDAGDRARRGDRRGSRLFFRSGDSLPVSAPCGQVPSLSATIRSCGKPIYDNAIFDRIGPDPPAGLLNPHRRRRGQGRRGPCCGAEAAARPGRGGAFGNNSGHRVDFHSLYSIFVLA